MKTIKWLKISAILHVFYCFFCISSLLCYAINRYLDIHIFFYLGNILLFGWIINPIGLITLIVGLILYFSEKSVPDNQIKIGFKWIWFVMFFIIDLLLYLTSAVLTVVFTGGV